MCMRSRRERLLERRLKVVTDEEQEEFGAILKVGYMSEDEDDTDGEGWRHLELPWRANNVTQFLRTLDSRIKDTKKEFMKERTKRTSSGLSFKKAPKDAPTWAVKQSLRTEFNKSASASRGGTALRTRGGRGVRTRGGVRRSISYSAKDVLSSFTD
ncbi:uncharacterized protein LOC114544589 [Dendronephthya gigantea]|nr:uncharacterized protein LOC114542639 [Dendronephthya gigantea]XP_028418980.1 uncharacterized protein LOC114544589 [Dendronephthya gigantea]